jgi:hypothetical protein
VSEERAVRRRRRVFLVAFVFFPAVAAVAYTATVSKASEQQTPKQQIAALKKQIRVLRAQVKGLQGEVKFLNGRVAALQQEAQLIPQLADIAAVTGKYRDLATALAEGYVKVDAPCIPQAGSHYQRGGWPSDNVLDSLRPEFLMYAPSNAGPKLVAVEYAVPARFPRPTFLGGAFETYTNGPGEPIWYLHLWLWQLNPAGVFSPMNMTVEC